MNPIVIIFLLIGAILFLLVLPDHPVREFKKWSRVRKNRRTSGTFTPFGESTTSLVRSGGTSGTGVLGYTTHATGTTAGHPLSYDSLRMAVQSLREQDSTTDATYEDIFGEGPAETTLSANEWRLHNTQQRARQMYARMLRDPLQVGVDMSNDHIQAEPTQITKDKLLKGHYYYCDDGDYFEAKLVEDPKKGAILIELPDNEPVTGEQGHYTPTGFSPDVQTMPGSHITIQNNTTSGTTRITRGGMGGLDVLRAYYDDPIASADLDLDGDEGLADDTSRAGEIFESSPSNQPQHMDHNGPEFIRLLWEDYFSNFSDD